MSKLLTVNRQIRWPIVIEKEITDKKEISHNIEKFCETVFKLKLPKSNAKKANFSIP